MKSLLVLAILACSVLSEPQRGFRSNGRRNNGRRGGFRASCGGGNKPNYNNRYLVSWKIGCSKFTQGQAENFCRQNGMKPISLDTPAKEKEFFDLVKKDRQKYFWTGGKVNHGRNPTITWPSGTTGTTNRWSHTGRNKLPQPDNREGNEFCVAVLNNFYKDGVKFHDVACSHTKPVICEP